MEIIKISARPTYHGYGKVKKNALQVSTFPHVLNQKITYQGSRSRWISV